MRTRLLPLPLIHFPSESSVTFFKATEDLQGHHPLCARYKNWQSFKHFKSSINTPPPTNTSKVILPPVVERIFLNLIRRKSILYFLPSPSLLMIRQCVTFPTLRQSTTKKGPSHGSHIIYDLFLFPFYLAT